MADNYLLVKGKDGLTVKLKLVDLADAEGTFALQTSTMATMLIQNLEQLVVDNIGIVGTGAIPHQMEVNDDGSINVALAEGDLGLAGLAQAITGEKTIDDLLTAISGLKTTIDAIKDTGGIKKIVDTVETRVTGTRIVEQKTEVDADADTQAITFADNIDCIEIYHEAEDWQEFEINGLAIMIPPGGYRVCVGGVPSADVVIPAALDCILWRLE